VQVAVCGGISWNSKKKIAMMVLAALFQRKKEQYDTAAVVVVSHGTAREKNCNDGICSIVLQGKNIAAVTSPL